MWVHRCSDRHPRWLRKTRHRLPLLALLPRCGFCCHAQALFADNQTDSGLTSGTLCCLLADASGCGGGFAGSAGAARSDNRSANSLHLAASEQTLESSCTAMQVRTSQRVRPSAANWTSSFAALATWLPSHAGLVGCLLIWGRYTYDEDRQQLQNALLTCSLKAAAPQMLKPWAFSTAGGTMLTAAVVSALPAHSLTALEALDGIFIGRQDALPVVYRISRPCQ